MVQIDLSECVHFKAPIFRLSIDSENKKRAFIFNE